jgi:hypothetical protein
MNRHLLLEFSDLFKEQPQPVETYLAGMGRKRAMQCVAHLLGYLSKVAASDRDYQTEWQQLFGPHSQPFADEVYYKMRAIARASRQKVGFLHAKAILQLFCYCFDLPEEEVKTPAELERDFFKACLVLNHVYIAEQSRATAEAKRLLPAHELAALSLGSTFSDAELVNQSLPNVTSAQLIKSVRFFEFLAGQDRFAPLLQAFLRYFHCETWQDFFRRLGGIIRPVMQSENPGTITVEVPQGPDFEDSCAFLRHFTLPEGQPLDTADFTSLRATPLWEYEPGSFILVFPVLVLEMLHKGLYFQFSRVNQTLDKGQRIKDWRSEYCDFFSEQYLLYLLLDATFHGRGLALSGNAIKAGWQLAGQAEPDYYFRQDHRAVVFESKDVLVHKDAKAGHDFPTYLREIEKKFYRDGAHPKATLQLLNNVKRLLEKALPFDTDYDPAQLSIYPVLVVHDRLYNQPGLNEVVNSWFQTELAELGAKGLPIQYVKPLVIIDVDTILAFHEHFRDGKLVFEDVLDAYLLHINPTNRVVQSQAELEAVILGTVHPFSLFLENYAHERGLSAVPEQMLYELLNIVNEGAQDE